MNSADRACFGHGNIHLRQIESMPYIFSEKIRFERLKKNPSVVRQQKWVKPVHTVESKGRHLHGPETISGTIMTK